MRSGTGAHVGHDLILTCVRWDVASLCRARQSEARLQERGVTVAPGPINHWLPQERLPLGRGVPAAHAPRLDQLADGRTARPITGHWRTLPCGGAGEPIRCTFSAESSAGSTRQAPVFTQAICRHGVPAQTMMDGSASPCGGHPRLQYGARDGERHPPGERRSRRRWNTTREPCSGAPVPGTGAHPATRCSVPAPGLRACRGLAGSQGQRSRDLVVQWLW